mgnify:CR=1 FL=1
MSSINDIVFNWLRHRKRKKDMKDMCKRLLKALDDNQPITHAMILAMGIVFKQRVIDNSAQLSKALNYPEKMSSERLGLIFELLQAIQNKMNQEKQGLDQKLEYMNIHEDSTLPHWDMSLLGMDLWMVTIGSAYYPKIMKQVAEIWRQLDSSFEETEEAIKILRSLEHTVQDLSDSNKGMYGEMGDAQWLEACQYRPYFMMI